MKRRTEAEKIAAEDALAKEIVSLYRADRFDTASCEFVRRASRRHPRCAYIALMVAEYKDSAFCKLRDESPWGLAEVERAFRRVIDLDPTYGRAWEGLAAVLDIQMKLTEAAKAARKAIRYYGHPDSMAILARILAQQGKKAESRRWANHPKVRRSKRSSCAKAIATGVLSGEWDPDWRP